MPPDPLTKLERDTIEATRAELAKPVFHNGNFVVDAKLVLPLVDRLVGRIQRHASCTSKEDDLPLFDKLILAKVRAMRDHYGQGRTVVVDSELYVLLQLVAVVDRLLGVKP